MKELIEELKNNQKINGTECVRIDYILERLEDIEKEITNYLDDRINLLDSLLYYSLKDNKEDYICNEYSMRKMELVSFKREVLKDDSSI